MEAAREKPPAPLDDYDLLQDSADLLEAFPPSDLSEASSGQADPSARKANTATPMQDPSELSLQETEALLHTLDATSFFEDPAQPTPTSESPAELTVAHATTTLKENTVAPQTTTASKPVKGKMRNPSRERLQAELAYLRKKVVELEGELTTLQHGSTAVVEHQVDANGRAIVPVWQRIAERQQEGRQRAETENLRLRGTLQGQIMLARHLEQVLRKRPNVGVLKDPSEIISSPQKRLRLAPGDSSMYDTFLAEIDVAYQQIDNVFRQNGLESSIDDSLRHADVKTHRGHDGHDVLYAELLDVNIIPFELDRVGPAAWRSVKRQYYSKTPYDAYHYTQFPDDMFALKYRMKRDRKGKEVELDAIIVMRKFVEPDRVALVWRSISRANADLTGIFTDETGWSVFKPVPPSAGLSLAGTGTVMHSCVHVVPKRFGSEVVQMEDEVGLFTKAVIDSYEDVTISINATMEDILLEETLATPDPVALKVWSW